MSKQIDLKKINQFILCKQHLTKDSKEKNECVVKVTKDICGLHAQVATTPYLSLWNRVESFRKEVLKKELYEKRNLVKIWCMRRTVHIVPVEQVMEYYQATKRVGGRKTFRIETIHKRILNTLDEKGPLTLQELNNHLLELKNKVQTKYGEVYIGQQIVREMCHSTLLVPSKPKGGWKSNLHTYSSFKKWLPSVNLQALNEFEAKKNVVLYYLSGFGPVTTEDISWWSGLNKRDIKKILNLREISDKIESIKIQGLDASFFILKSDSKCLERFSIRKGTVHLLPKFDPYIMGYKNRQRLISPEYEKKVFCSTRGEINPTILVNGFVIGFWNPKEEKNKIKVTLSFFEKINRVILDRIEEQAEKLAKFISDKNSEIIIEQP
ncbi:MAG: winged helix DNA-binding domain-containing protein [Candidatus Methanofastidiosia archaeon]